MSVIKKYRFSITQLRSASHSLRIETGRHGQNRIDRPERICQVCDTGDLEDEYHFVLVCAAYNELRVKYMNIHFRRNPSVFKFLQLINSSDTTTINNLSYFIYNAFKIRTSRLQNTYNHPQRTIHKLYLYYITCIVFITLFDYKIHNVL